MVEVVEEIHTALLSSTTAKRRAGLKRLHSCMENKEFLCRLDASTQKLSQVPRLTQFPATWPALSQSLCSCMHTEFLNGTYRSKQEEALVASSVTKFVIAAGKSDTRSNLSYPLRRKAEKIFATLALGLKEHSLSSVTGRECNSVLRSHLLPVKEYCSFVNASLKQNLISIYLKWLKEENYMRHKDEFYRNSDTLRLVLMQMAGDLSPKAKRHLCKFFANSVKFLDNFSNIGFVFIRTLNVFLCEYGFDVLSKVKPLSDLVYQFIRSTWKKSRHKGYRLVVCFFIELELHLNIQENRADVLSTLFHYISKDLEEAESDPFLSDVCGSKQYMRTAALIASRILKLDSTVGFDLKGEHQMKRQKGDVWYSKVWTEAMVSSAKWGPTICILLKSHSNKISPSILEEWLVELHQRLGNVENALLSNKSNSTLLWLIRIANHLALAFWKAEEKERLPRVVDLWNDIYSRIARWMIGSLGTSALKEEALAILCSISLIGNVPCHFIEELLSTDIWEGLGGLPLLSFFAASLCLPNKRVYQCIGDNIKNFPQLLWSTSKQMSREEESDWQACDLVITNLISLLLVPSPNPKILHELRTLSETISGRWFVASEEVIYATTHDEEAQQLDPHFMERILYTIHDRKEEVESVSCNLRSSQIAANIFKTISQELPSAESKDRILWLKILLKTCTVTKKQLDRRWKKLEPKCESWHKEAFAGNVKFICKSLPEAIDAFLCSCDCNKGTIPSVNGLVEDLVGFEDADGLHLKEIYPKILSSVSCAIKKLLASYPSIQEKQNPRLEDMDFEDDGLQRESLNRLVETQDCVLLLLQSLKNLGSKCPADAYNSLCEMQSEFTSFWRKTNTEISLLSAMCFVGVHLSDVPAEPFESLCAIQKSSQSVQAQAFVLKSLKGLLLHASESKALSMYQPAKEYLIRIVKGIKKWVSGNESTCSLRISLGKTLEILIELDAVSCHNECLDELLLVFLRDECYLVRQEAAKQIGILFDSWQDHVEVFLTISRELMLPPCQELISVESFGEDDVEAILSSTFALALIAAKSKKVESYCVVLICTILISNFSNKIVLEYAKKILFELAQTAGYEVDEYLKFFQKALFKNVASSVLLSSNFSLFVSEFFKQELSIHSAFFPDLVGCIPKGKETDLFDSMDLASYKAPNIKAHWRTWTLRFLSECSKKAEPEIAEHLAKETNLVNDIATLENKVVILSTILDCVVHDSSVQIEPFITAEEGANLVLALLALSSQQHASAALVSDTVFSLALYDMKSGFGTVSAGHKIHHVYSLQILVEVLVRKKAHWWSSINCAIKICSENLDKTNQEVSVIIMEQLMRIRVTKENKAAIDLSYQYEVYVAISRLSELMAQCQREKKAGSELIKSKLSKIVEYSLASLEFECQGETKDILEDVKAILQSSNFEYKGAERTNLAVKTPLVEKVMHLHNRSKILPADVFSRCLEQLDVDSENLDDLDFSLEDIGLLRSFCLLSIKKEENLTQRAMFTLSKILAYVGPFPSSCIGITMSDGLVEGDKSLGGEKLTVRLNRVILSLLISWTTHKNSILAYESLLALIYVGQKKEALVAGRTMEQNKRECLRQIWDMSKSSRAPRQIHSSSKEDAPCFDISCWSTRYSFEERVHRITMNLLPFCRSSCLAHCKNLIARNPSISKSILPLLIEDIALHNRSDSSLCQEVSVALRDHVFGSNKSNELSSVFLYTLERLRTVFFLLQQDHLNRNNNSIHWKSSYWFVHLNCLDIAKLAFSRHEYFTALLNIELWYEESFGTLHGIDKNNDNGLTASSPRKQLLPSTEKMLADIFERIGEDDALYAFATTIDFATQLKIFEHEKRWDKVLQSYDILLNNDVDHREERLEKGILKCMKNLGCSHLLATHGRKYQQSVNFELSEEQYERAWHQCKWDFPAIDLNAADEPKLNQGIYNCLYALKSKDVDFFKGSKNILHKFAVNNICVNGKESAAIVNDSIIVLQMIDLLQNSFNARSTIVECGWSLNGKEIQIYANSTFSKDPGNALNKTIQLEDRYHLLKPLFKLYSSALTALDCKIGLQRAHLYEACVSRKAKDLTQSRANMAIVKQMCKVNKIDRNFEIEIQLEELQNLWDQGLNKVALDECKRLYKAVEEQNRSNSTTLFQASVASMLLGRWLADSCSESVDRIREILGDSVNFAKNAALLGNTDKADELHYTLCSSHFNLAQFADRQYRAIQKQQNSPEWQDRQKLLRHTNKQLEALASKTGYKNSTSYRDILHYKVIAERFHEEDKKEAVRVEESKELFLQLSLTHYTKALTTGDFFDNQVVFRLCQLWFELSSNDKVNAIMAKAGTDVASYKFLCLIYQIGSRLATGNKTFQSAISALLIKMCFEHPYQTLPQIFQFFNASRGKDGTDRDSKRNSGYAVDKTKVIAAKAILEKVKREDKRSSERLFQLQLIIDAYIHLAVLPVKKDGNKPLDPHMPRSVRELKNLECVPIITKDLQVDKSCQYATFPHFSYFKSEIRMVGGVNAPKLLTAVDSEGHLHLQLAKSGDDDLRQDAVMQQLFNLVNHLLEACAKTRKRHLRLKTYNVVPLTPAAGLVEWVRETMPLKEYLVDAGNGNGAHRRLRPKDWSYNQCLSYLYRQQNAKPKAKKDAFTTICKHFKPVMHHFFLEHYVNTSRWFQKRLAYTRSIAVSSMVGYVVGLGDRHGSNILIDEKTAEVIHIDLGIAFEQGKVSKIPETVPFRLTRDIVDGMGVSGVEGTMRRCSEEVMEVLRANKEQLLTIVEVFIHDPLYRWALSPVKALFRQRENVENENAENNEGEDFKYQSIMANGFELSAPMASSQMVENADAERAVLKVREKLEGMEHGMEKTSIEGQVQQLLREAQDVNNLSVMYCGWGPFL